MSETMKEKLMKKMMFDALQKALQSIFPVDIRVQTQDGHKINLSLEQVYKSKDNRWVLVFNPIEEEQKP